MNEVVFLPFFLSCSLSAVPCCVSRCRLCTSRWHSKKGLQHGPDDGERREDEPQHVDDRACAAGEAGRGHRRRQHHDGAGGREAETPQLWRHRLTVQLTSRVSRGQAEGAAEASVQLLAHKSVEVCAEMDALFYILVHFWFSDAAGLLTWQWRFGGKASRLTPPIWKSELDPGVGAENVVLLSAKIHAKCVYSQYTMICTPKSLPPKGLQILKKVCQDVLVPSNRKNSVGTIYPGVQKGSGLSFAKIN